MIMMMKNTDDLQITFSVYSAERIELLLELMLEECDRRIQK